MAKGFLDKLTEKWDGGKFVCIGLDQQAVSSGNKSAFEFNKNIIDSTHNLVCAYKPNSAFYEALGAEGWNILKQTVDYLRNNYPDIPLILDAKRADIGNTNTEYAKAIFDKLGFDALTVHPYLGKEAMQPFLDRTDKGIIVLVKTSNPGSGEFQDLEVGTEKLPLYQAVAKNVASSWNYNGNCAVVVGATYPDELKKVRGIIGDMPILIPGIGAQGGDLEAILQAGLNSKGQGIIISVSRSIIFAQNPKEAAQTLHSQIQEILKNV